ncbi:hypothetical protein BCF55_1300 [Hydrogenivirga caldilitoris]|uniref:Uncharacterized protein n=1 Tax=Hydrogenivirga caldilitoris TaxID=246264 RepID=A0A497XRW6_9AQUI|nr:hypothetical protein [Hydrogenivirga caldilitoris]RLJ71011.1 hypothetical protein BCF55_1300 [Hydrogenivirga caldilitoris]
MAKKKEELKVESLEEEVQELRKSLFGIFEALLPPKEVREEVLKNLYTIELSFLKVFKTLLDYQVESLEHKIEKKSSRKRAQKIEVE